MNMSEGNHSHPSLKNFKGEQSSDGSIVLSYDVDMGGKSSTVRTKLTPIPPLGAVFEVLDGPMAGSRSLQYYTPKGKETGITVVGEWKSSVMSDDQLRGTVMGFLQTVFEEDQANLARM